MPQYEFTCRECHKDFSEILTIERYEKDKDSWKCPHCGSKKTERKWAAFYAVTSKKS